MLKSSSKFFFRLYFAFVGRSRVSRCIEFGWCLTRSRGHRKLANVTKKKKKTEQKLTAWPRFTRGVCGVSTPIIIYILYTRWLPSRFIERKKKTSRLSTTHTRLRRIGIDRGPVIKIMTELIGWPTYGGNGGGKRLWATRVHAYQSESFKHAFFFFFFLSIFSPIYFARIVRE